MKKANTLTTLKLSKTAKATFTKYLDGKITGREVQRKLTISPNRFYSILGTILREAVARGQVKAEELFNN